MTADVGKEDATSTGNELIEDKPVARLNALCGGWLSPLSGVDTATVRAAAERIASDAKRIRELEEALEGLFKRLDHPLNGGQFVTYFLRWPEVEAARKVLESGQ